MAATTDVGILWHKQLCFRTTELLRALCRAKRGKNSPPENPIMPEAELPASGIFYLPIIAVKEAGCIQRIIIIC